MKMSPRERMMAAMRGELPDRVPCAPDFSCMIPCKRTGKSFEQVLLYNDPPLWKAYLEAVRYFGIDGWFIYGGLLPVFKNTNQYHTVIERDEQGRAFRRTRIDTPDGPLTERVIYPAGDPETVTEKLIKDFKEDFPKFRHLIPEVTGVDDTLWREQQKEVGEDAVMGISVAVPGFQTYITWFDGGLENLTYAYYDEPELFEELNQLYERHTLSYVEKLLDKKPDSILIGASGSITLQSPSLWDELSFPTISKIARMCRQAGVICGMHSCGKEAHIVKRVAEETDLDYINPLEVPPMGDCSLRELKQKYGKKITLMGNLHTTDVMLRGTADEVRKACEQAIDDAGAGGRFILSTGDQCGRDTPEENIFAMVDVCKNYGKY